MRLWLLAAVVIAVASCRACDGCAAPAKFWIDGPETVLPPPMVKYEVVSPCVYRYYDAPAKPGFPHPEVEGIAYAAFKVDERRHLITFTSCDPDAGMQGKVELVYVYGSPVDP